MGKMTINQERLWNRLIEMSQYGKQENGGVTRFSFTEEERKAKDKVISYMKEAGMKVREDAVGNLIGRKEGRIGDLPAVLVGSHIDSVPNGGIFDGNLGVLAGIEVIQSMTEKKIETDHPIEVIAFTDEEGSRFGFGMIGSRAIAGTLTPQHLYNRDVEGVTIEQAMKKVGLDPTLISEAAKNQKSIKAYVELHIEQGKVLENHDLSVGVVSGIAGPLWTRWTLKGEAGHAGATPMNMRKDPLMAAAKIMMFIESETKKYESAVATVGQLTVKPGGINVIPGEVEFSLDLRDISLEDRDQLEDSITSFAYRLCENEGIEIEIETLQRVDPVPCSQEIRTVIEDSLSKVGVPSLTLASGAGHDGMQFKDFCPIGMIFIRSKDGLSHNPAEWSSKEDCGIGTKVLYETILQLAKRIYK